MTQDRAISDSVDRLKALLEDKFGLRRGDLAQRAAMLADLEQYAGSMVVDLVEAAAAVAEDAS